VACSGGGRSASSATDPSSVTVVAPFDTATTLSPPTTAAAPAITGYGATLSEWTATHIQDKNYDMAPAYGPNIQSPEGPTPQFIAVRNDGQRIFSFIEVLPEGTSLATAQSLTLTQLPADTARGAFAISDQNGSCGFWNLSSATLAAVGAGGYNGEVVVEMAYDDSNGAPTYRPSDINTITIEVGQSDSTGTC
jgi:hypothetical protein